MAAGANPAGDIAGSSSCRWNRIEQIASSRSRASPPRRSGPAFAGATWWHIGKNPPITAERSAEKRSYSGEPLPAAAFE